MSKPEKTLARLLRGASDANIAFDDLRNLLRHLGFTERIRGSHHIFTREGIEEILNLQPKLGKAKPYQVRQVRGVIESHGLAEDADETTTENDADEESETTDAT